MRAVTVSRWEFTEIALFRQAKLILVGSYRSFPPAGPKSWGEVLPGLDLRVDQRGFIVVEPSRGVKGAYAWRDLSAPIASLPLEVCEFLIEARQEQKRRAAEERAAQRAEGGTANSNHVQSAELVQRPEGSIPIPDQARFFRDVEPGAGQHRRLLAVALALRTHLAASQDDLRRVIEFHASKFSTPFEDWPWIDRTVLSICRDYPPSAPRA